MAVIDVRHFGSIVAGRATSGQKRAMAAYRKLNLMQDVENMAPKFGLAPGLESRFARSPLGLAASGVSYFKFAPGFRMPFGHHHADQEEVYVIVRGSARIKIDDDVVELDRWDLVRVPPKTMRALEGGPDGAEVIAFGAPSHDNKDAEMVPGWWED
jgi:quercetin dioxygenase-like cupin family protein